MEITVTIPRQIIPEASTHPVMLWKKWLSKLTGPIVSPARNFGVS